MKPKGRLLPLLLALVASFALPAAAAAKPNHFVIPPSFSVEATLPQSNGFTLSATSIGHRQVSVIARKGGEFALYRARGRASRHGFSADLGRFGQMQMRFVGSTHLLPKFKGCKGRRTIRGVGTFHGRVRFRGREGFVSASAVRVRGRYTRSFRQVCDESGSELTVAVLGGGSRRAGPRLRKLSAEVLEAEAHAEGRTTSFNAIAISLLGSPPFVSASVTETIGRVRLLAFTQPRRDQGSLVFGERGADPATATVRPGAPFVGEASYSKPKDGSAEWSGDLRVPIAGFGNMELTGPGFEARACHRNLAEFSSCESAQGSGSHSQPLALARLSSLR